MAIDQVLARRVRTALEAAGPRREVKMFGGLTFMLHGHMCCGVASRVLVARLGLGGAAQAIADGSAKPFAPSGQPASGMVAIADAGALGDAALRAWVDRAVAFVGTLPPRI